MSPGPTSDDVEGQLAMASKDSRIVHGHEAMQRQESGKHTPLLLLREYVQQPDVRKGQECLEMLQNKQLSDDEAEQALELLLDIKENPPLLGSLTGTLLNSSEATRKMLANKIERNATAVFEQLYARGDAGCDALCLLSLDKSIWRSVEAQATAQADLFGFYIAKLPADSARHSSSVVKSVTRLLGVAEDGVTRIGDGIVFNMVLSYLDIRNDRTLRSQALVIAAKLLQGDDEKGAKLFSSFIETKMAGHSSNDFIVAFSAAAAIFPIAPSIVGPMFLVPGFLQQLVPSLHKRPVSNKDEGE